MTEHSDTPAIVSDDDLYGAVYAFLAGCCTPALDPQNIIRGWENRVSLPPGTEEYAVMTIVKHQRHGTTVEGEGTEPGTLELRELVEVTVRLDFCSAGDNARRRAQTVETLARSPAGANWFRRRHGLGCLYADAPADRSFAGTGEQFVRRWTTALHLTHWRVLALREDFFTTARLTRLENVDVHHPPVTGGAGGGGARRP